MIRNLTKAPDGMAAPNYFDDLLLRLNGDGVPLPVAVDRVATAYLDGKPINAEPAADGREINRLPNTICLAVAGWKGETQVMQMDLAGFAVSAGSACSSGKVRPSKVLQAMGYDDLTAASAIRVSFGPSTKAEELDAFADAWTAQYQRFRAKAA